MLNATFWEIFQTLWVIGAWEPGRSRWMKEKNDQETKAKENFPEFG